MQTIGFHKTLHQFEGFSDMDWTGYGYVRLGQFDSMCGTKETAWRIQWLIQWLIQRVMATESIYMSSKTMGETAPVNSNWLFKNTVDPGSFNWFCIKNAWGDLPGWVSMMPHGLPHGET